MNESGTSAMSSHDNMPQPTPGRPQNPMENYRFSSEELKVLRECNTESFFQRSLPIGTVLGVGTFYGVKAGYLTGNPKWGAVPKVVLACTLGYFLGKFSYQKKCAEKIMQLPNSRLGQMLRQRRNAGTFQDTIDPGGISSMAPFAGFASDTYSDAPASSSQSSLDMDTYQQIHDRLDETVLHDAPSVEGDTTGHVTSRYTSYDDLRKKNREEYTNSKSALFRPSAEPAKTPAAPAASDDVTRQQGKRNQYGDIWE